MEYDKNLQEKIKILLINTYSLTNQKDIHANEKELFQLASSIKSFMMYLKEILIENFQNG